MSGILFEARAFRLSSRTARYASRSEPGIETIASQGILDPSSSAARRGRASKALGRNDHRDAVRGKCNSPAVRGTGFRCDSDGREALAHEAAVALLVGLERMGGALRVLSGVPSDLAVGR